AQGALAALRSALVGAQATTATAVAVLDLSAVLAALLAAQAATTTPTGALAVLRQATQQAQATTATAQGVLAVLRQALAEASQETGAAVVAVSILRWLDHTVVASTATSAGNFRTEVIVGLLRLLVSGALRPTIGAVEFWPAVIATSRQPFIRGE
ncbi:MAG: hypothetical protein WBC13_00780, partial [Dokdonella sp.]